MSRLTKIKQVLMQMLESFNEVSTDKGIMAFDSDNELPVEGEQVWMVDDKGERFEAETGDYLTADGTVIKVDASKVVSVTVKETMSEETPEEPEETEEKPEEEHFEEEQSQESNETQENQEEGAQENAEEKPIVVESLELTPEEAAEIGAQVKDEKDKRIEQLEGEVNSLKAQLEEMTNKFNAIANLPAAESITKPGSHEFSNDKMNEAFEELKKLRGSRKL